MFQKDVMAESEDILKIGLLFGEDINATTEDLPAVLSFQHKLIQEYLAAVYIVENMKLESAATFLNGAFPSWKEIETHREVIQFACGILADTNASPIGDHVAKVLAQHVHNECNIGKDLPYLTILQSCQKEGGLSALNPYMSEYPACGCPLAEVLTKTEVVYVTGIDRHDTLQLNPSPCSIILRFWPEESGNFTAMNSESFDRLWHALHSVAENVVALQLYAVSSENVTKLHKFPKLKTLTIKHCSKAAVEELTESINCWGLQPKLTRCHLENMSIPGSLISTLCKCMHVMHIDLSFCNMRDKVSILMVSPPLAMRELLLDDCSLDCSDLNHITQTIKEGRLKNLQMLGIENNPVGEIALGCLLEATISTKPQTGFTLKLGRSAVNKDGKSTDLSEQFTTEWKTRLKGTNINVDYIYCSLFYRSLMSV